MRQIVKKRGFLRCCDRWGVFACVFLSSFYFWDALPGLLRIGAGFFVAFCAWGGII